MPSQSTPLSSNLPGDAGDDDVALASRIGRGDEAAFETLMRRHNGRLFRAVRAIVRDDGVAEDVLQDAYLDAYRHIADFRGGAQLATWLTRIAINHALMRLRKQKRDRVVVSMSDRYASDETEAAQQQRAARVRARQMRSRQAASEIDKRKTATSRC